MSSDDENKRLREEAEKARILAEQEELRRILEQKRIEDARIKNLADEIERRGRGSDDKPKK